MTLSCVAASRVRIIQCHSIAMGPAGRPRNHYGGVILGCGANIFYCTVRFRFCAGCCFFFSSKLSRRAAPRHDSEATMATHFESLNSMSLRCYAQRKIVLCTVPHSLRLSQLQHTDATVNLGQIVTRQSSKPDIQQDISWRECPENPHSPFINITETVVLSRKSVCVVGSLKTILLITGPSCNSIT